VKTTFRLIGSFLGGIVTFYAIAFALSFTQFTKAGWLFSQYIDVFGLASSMGHLVQTAPFSDDDEFYGPHGRLTAWLVTVGFWTLLFGALYFRFLFRARKTI
jgi:hypothetical protein